MSLRAIIIGFLIFATIVIPLVQLSFGFHYVNYTSLCPVQSDIMILMSIGGVFQAIFFAIGAAFLYAVTPARFKQQKNKKSEAQQSAKGNNRASLILIGKSYYVAFILVLLSVIYVGCITGIFGACAIIFFVLLQLRVFGNINNVQYTDSTLSSYCLFAIFSSAFGLIIATYVAFLLYIIVAFIFICGICLPK
jgi:hypothetical protein